MEAWLKQNIEKAVRVNSEPWTMNLLRQISGLPTNDNKDYLANDKSKPHELLCELTQEIVRRNASALFTNLHVGNTSRVRICDLPTYDGRNILDLAREKEAFALFEAIQRAGGKSFPIVLRSQLAQTYIFEWRKLKTTSELRDHFNMITSPDKPALLKSVNYNDVIISMAGRLALSGNAKAAAVLLRNLRLDNFDKQNNSNLFILQDIAMGAEAYETLAAVRDVLKLHEDLKTPPSPSSSQTHLRPGHD